MVDWLTKAVREDKIRDGTTVNGRPAFWRGARHVRKGAGERMVYSPDTNSTPNILNRDYFRKLEKKYISK